MSTMFDDVDVVCPFFKNSDIQKISCEGVGESSTTTLNFPNRKKRDKHKEQFCDRGYKKCEIHKMLEAKYND